MHHILPRDPSHVIRELSDYMDSSLVSLWIAVPSVSTLINLCIIYIFTSDVYPVPGFVGNACFSLVGVEKTHQSCARIDRVNNGIEN